jgi:hypothetical protein
MWFHVSTNTKKFRNAIVFSGVKSVVPLVMARQLKSDETHEALEACLSTQAALIHRRYGPRIDWNQLLLLLEDRACVRFPCEIRFDAEPLLPGEFAHVVPRGPAAEDGFTIYLHPFYAVQLDQAVYLVLHQLVRVNYGIGAGPEDAETFGAIALGVAKTDYYRVLCDLSGQLGGDELI